jgi:hypothetical protein
MNKTLTNYVLVILTAFSVLSCNVESKIKLETHDVFNKVKENFQNPDNIIPDMKKALEKVYKISLMWLYQKNNTNY